MKIISEDKFKKKKSSDTIVVLGSGYSVNKIREEDWNKLRLFDSIGFNWFCKHDFEPTFYLVREQANISRRITHDETVDIFLRRINRYIGACCVICDVTSHTPRAHKYAREKRIKHECIILKDDNNKRHCRKLRKYFIRNPFVHGLIHGYCTLFNVLHLVTYLDYQRIVFVGVDLYDSRYFWLPKNMTRHTVRKKRKHFLSKHAVAFETLRLIRRYKKFRPNVTMYVLNKKSLLTRRIPYIRLSGLCPLIERE